MVICNNRAFIFSYIYLFKLLFLQKNKKAKENKEVVSIAFQGNIVEVWEKFLEEDIYVDLGSDQTSLHNPWAGGYYPIGLSFEESNKLMANNPKEFKINLRVPNFSISVFFSKVLA